MPPSSVSRRLLGKLPAAMMGPAFGTLGANAAIQGLAFAGSYLVARRLGVEVRGEYAGAAAWCALLSALSDFGVSQAVPYRCARTPTAPGPTIGSGLAFAAVAGSIGALIGLLATLLILLPRNPTLAMATAWYLPSVPIVLVGSYASVASQGLGLVRTFNSIRVAYGVSTLAGILLALGLHISSGAGLTGAIMGCQTFATAFALFSLHRRTSAKGWRIDAEEVRHLWRFGIRTHVGNLAWVANSKLDQMIMSVTLSTRDLGVYSIAVSYAGLVFALASAMTDSNFVRLAAELPIAERMRRIRIALGRILRVSVGITVVLALLGFPLLPLVFGPAFVAAAPIAAILMVGGVLLSLNYTIGVGLRASGHPIVTSLGEGVGLLVTAIGLPLLLVRFGIVSAAIVSILSYTATLVVLIVFALRFARAEGRTPEATEVVAA